MWFQQFDTHSMNLTKMKKIFLLLSLLGSYLFTYAQDSLSNALLWKISGNGLEKPSYLFGTIHMIPVEDYFLPKGTEECLNQTNNLYLEIAMDEMMDMSNLAGVMDQMFMANDTSLADLLTKTEYDLVSGHFEKMGLPMMFFERMKPMFLSAFGSPEMNPQNFQDGQIKSYEMEFNEMAKKHSIPVKGLETVAFQLSVFDSIPYKAQAQMLVESLKSNDGESSGLKEMIKSYIAQDLNKLSESITAEETAMNPYLDMMLNNRNKKWIPIMAEVMKKEPCFFAVGAGHLGGKEGVINLLRKNNFVVEPVLK